MKKLALRGNEVAVGDTLTGVWWFPDGKGVVESLTPYEGPVASFAGAGSQVATIRGTDRKMTLPQINWYIVDRHA